MLETSAVEYFKNSVLIHEGKGFSLPSSCLMFGHLSTELLCLSKIISTVAYKAVAYKKNRVLDTTFTVSWFLSYDIQLLAM